MITPHCKSVHGDLSKVLNVVTLSSKLKCPVLAKAKIESYKNSNKKNFLKDKQIGCETGKFTLFPLRENGKNCLRCYACWELYYETITPTLAKYMKKICKNRVPMEGFYDKMVQFKNEGKLNKFLKESESELQVIADCNRRVNDFKKERKKIKREKAASLSKGDEKSSDNETAKGGKRKGKGGRGKKTRNKN